LQALRYDIKVCKKKQVFFYNFFVFLLEPKEYYFFIDIYTTKSYNISRNPKG